MTLRPFEIRPEIVRNAGAFFGNRRFLFYISGFWLLDWHCIRIADGLRMHRSFVDFLVFLPSALSSPFCVFRIFFTPTEFFSDAPIPQTAICNDQFSVIEQSRNDAIKSRFADPAHTGQLISVAEWNRSCALIHQRQERYINAGLIGLQSARAGQPVGREEPEIRCFVFYRHDPSSQW